MGHKVHPIGFRLGVVKGWQSRWYAEHDYKDVYSEDRQIRTRINKELANAAVSRIEVERAAANQVLVKIYTAKPGIVIGKSGEKVEKLKAVLEAQTKKRVRLEINEIRQPELDAYLVARGIAEQLEKRVSFRRAMKQAVQKSIRANAKGVKVICGGRLGGAEIARSEKEVEGKVPLHTLRADIDYGLAEAHTTFGVIGVKVWIYRGDILPSKRREPGEQAEVVAQPFSPREGGERRERGPRPQGDRPRYQGGERGERGPRPQGERQGERSDRGPRPQGDRPRYQGGERPERGPRPQGDRPQGERPPRPQGERPERGPRPQGDRPQGDRPPGERSERGPRPQGDRPQGERAPRPQGDRPERGPRPQGDRPPREPREPRGERTSTAAAPGSAAAPETPPTPPTVQTPDVPQTPDTGTPETPQSE